ncbi:MAG: DUF6503 family protein [Saprospiraceae bacterium]|nr:DUF6503 family protein [Saprospiraceae bacterium]
MKKILFTLFIFSFAILSNAQTPLAQEILSKSIQYHDPQDKWGKEQLVLNLEETRPNGSIRYTRLEIDLSKDYFFLKQKNGEDEIIRIMQRGECQHQYQGKSDISEETAQRLRLTCERTAFFRNYYTYLWGLPMKLKDPGTILHEQVEMSDYFGKPAYKLKVTYDANVGSDTWYFYFDLKTYALVGYRFYHDETKNDGEYILLEDEAVINGLRLPKNRKWYMHQDAKFLGTDTLVNGK